jgi:hypothetical protein
MSSQHGSTPSSDPSTAHSFEPSISISTLSGIRGKTDLAWGHCRKAPELSVGCKKTKLVCLYCAKAFTGGGINRFKQHFSWSERRSGTMLQMFSECSSSNVFESSGEC